MFYAFASESEHALKHDCLIAVRVTQYTADAKVTGGAVCARDRIPTGTPTCSVAVIREAALALGLGAEETALYSWLPMTGGWDVMARNGFHAHIDDRCAR